MDTLHSLQRKKARKSESIVINSFLINVCLEEENRRKKIPADTIERKVSV